MAARKKDDETQARRIQAVVKKEGVAFISLQFSDLLGQPKIVTVSAEKLDDILDSGIWFDGSSVEGFARIAESDMLLRPDLNTFAIVPWNTERKTARLICNVFMMSGEPLQADPRYILQQVLRRAKEKGFDDYCVGAELEVYLLERSALPKLQPHDHKGYFDYTPQSRAINVIEKTMEALMAFGIQSEMYHHEVGRGQHEIDVRYANALVAADNLLTTKLALKAYTSGTELKATWMPKPLTGFAGNGLHVHQSLWKNGGNVFYAAQGEHGLSKIAMHFLAGQLAHAKALSAIVSPTVNSYKRLVSGFEAPVYICWGQTNRSSLIRIPHSSKERVAQGARLEYRAPDPSCNPYLAFAALLAAGLDGIKQGDAPPKAVEEDVYHMSQESLAKQNIATLPGDLRGAIEALESDEVILSIFGVARDRYLEAKKLEWRQFMYEVTPWEVDRYL